jgi:hypothetical protein
MMVDYNDDDMIHRLVATAACGGAANQAGVVAAVVASLNEPGPVVPTMLSIRCRGLST